jgi:hypothetical protein
MLKRNSFSFIRKLLVLSVLMGGLFFAVSTDRAKAQTDFCCSVCDEPHQACIADCQASSSNQGKVWQCIQEECNPPWFDCMSNNPVCDPGC